jgi:predicted dehydrogenase
MRRLKWAILGPGSIAAAFAEAIIEVNGSIYAVGSRSLERAMQFASSLGIEKAYGSYEDLLADEDIDIVYIATPHSNHYEYILKCLQHNKHVLCEKAITINADQLAEVMQLAESKSLIVAEAMTVYHMPLYKQLREMIGAGRIGKVKMLQASLGSMKDYDVTNRFFNKDLAGGAMLDIGTYAMSFVRYFLSSQPNTIVSLVKQFETGVDEQVGISLKNSEDEMAVISLSLRAKMPKTGLIAGELAYITIDDLQRPSKATIIDLDGNTEVITAGESAKAFVYEVEDMNHWVLNHFTADTVSLSLDVFKVMDEVRKQGGISYPFE